MMWIKQFAESNLNRKLYAPYSIEKDWDYYSELQEKYATLIELLKSVNADEESIVIAEKSTCLICKALQEYYHGRTMLCYQLIEELVKECNNPLAISNLSSSSAFPGPGNSEIQLFKARISNDGKAFTPKEMLHIPFRRRTKSGNYRFSIPGVTCLYLSNTSYGCWIEMGKPADHDFNVSPFILDGEQKVFNLAVMTRDLTKLDDGEKTRIHCWIRLLILMIATSFIIEEPDRTLKSEYIISQNVMMACKMLGYDGIAYYSKRVDDEMFAFSAINLALFADLREGYDHGTICEHLKVDEPMNYQFFNSVGQSQFYGKYDLRVANMPYIVNIGNYRHQYKYTETNFFKFDEHLFSRWKEKESLPWGNALL